MERHLSRVALRPVPAFVLPTETVALSAAAEEDTSLSLVYVSGLPNRVTTEPFAEALLQQAGLVGCNAPTCFEAWQGKPCGEAMICFEGRAALAEQCARHFNGCHPWDNSGTPVAARLLLVEEARAVLDEAHGGSGRPSALSRLL